jgi:hypothetical protein
VHKDASVGPRRSKRGGMVVSEMMVWLMLQPQGGSVPVVLAR